MTNKPDARWHQLCACGHPRGFHGKRGGHQEKCVGGYREPPCTCLAFKEPQEQQT